LVDLTHFCVCQNIVDFASTCAPIVIAYAPIVTADAPFVIADAPRVGFKVTLSNMAERLATAGQWDGEDCLAEANDALLSTHGDDSDRLKAAVLKAIGVQASSSVLYIEQKIKEFYGTHFRTLIGMRRLIASIESKSMTPSRLDKHFLMTIDWLKTYARRVDLMAKYSVSKRGFDQWKEQIISKLVASILWVSTSERSAFGVTN
jgi:hypothetical protein